MMQYEETGRIVTRVKILKSNNITGLENTINKFIEDKSGAEIQLLHSKWDGYYTALITYREYVES